MLFYIIVAFKGIVCRLLLYLKELQLFLYLEELQLFLYLEELQLFLYLEELSAFEISVAMRDNLLFLCKTVLCLFSPEGGNPL